MGNGSDKRFAECDFVGRIGWDSPRDTAENQPGRRTPYAQFRIFSCA
jgi:hypothetical protein